MKNKMFGLILGLIVNFSFVESADCQPAIDNEFFSGFYPDTSVPSFDCGVSGGFRYVSLGVGPVVFVPNIGVGYRERYTQFGWDGAVSFSTIGYVHQLSTHFVGHYYLNPMRRNSLYLGLGLMGSGVFNNHGDVGGTLSPDFVFGKELEREGDSRHFIEMHVAAPTMWTHSKYSNSMYFPLMYVKYGIAF